MDVFPKFIIEDGCLILGKVKYHKDLAEDQTKVKGGGWFSFDSETRTFTFSGESHDFGKAKFEDIKKAVEEGKVFDCMKVRNISDRYKFEYNDNGEITKLTPPLIGGNNK